jgi:hypothetical protein
LQLLEEVLHALQTHAKQSGLWLLHHSWAWLHPKLLPLKVLES